MIEDIMININRGSHKAANDPFIRISGVKLSAVILLQTFTCYKKNCALFKNLNNTSIYQRHLSINNHIVTLSKLLIKILQLIISKFRKDPS